jgi:hypothetical protein
MAGFPGAARQSREDPNFARWPIRRAGLDPPVQLKFDDGSAGQDPPYTCYTIIPAKGARK